MTAVMFSRTSGGVKRSSRRSTGERNCAGRAELVCADAAPAAVFCKLCAMRGTIDWFSGLNLVQKVLAVLFAALLLFSASYLVSSAVLWLVGREPRERRYRER